MHRRILLPVEDTSGVIAEFRSRFDPLSQNIPAHIAIVSLFQSRVGNEKISEWMALICKNRLSFDMKAGPAAFASGLIILPVKSQQKWLFEAHQKLSKKCGAPPSPGFTPHIPIGRYAVDAGQTVPEMEKEIANLPKTLHVNATRILLEAIDGEGISHPLHESRFRVAD